MRIWMSIALTLLALGPAEAALAPQYQRLVELQALLADGAIVEAFGMAHPIDGLFYVGPDQYRITGGPCQMQVRVVDAPTPHPAGFVGPREFALEPGALICN